MLDRYIVKQIADTEFIATWLLLIPHHTSKKVKLSHSSELCTLLIPIQLQRQGGRLLQSHSSRRLRCLPERPFPVMFILTFLGIISASMIFRLNVFQKAGGRNNEDSGFFTRSDTASLLFSFSSLYVYGIYNLIPSSSERTMNHSQCVLWDLGYGKSSRSFGKCEHVYRTSLCSIHPSKAENHALPGNKLQEKLKFLVLFFPGCS